MFRSLLPASRSRLLLVLLVGAAAAATGRARVGENLDLLTKRFGKGPEHDSPRHKAVWFVESIDGALVYTVTLNEKGISIAEGIKPIKRGLLTKAIAEDFLQDQMTLLKDSKTTRQVKPGEKYTFAGQVFSCGTDEYVLLDEDRGLLLIWSRGGVPSVMAITKEMMQHPPE